MRKRPSILLAGNYSNRTGYAWSNIYRLFNVIAREAHARGVGVCLSFAEVEPPVELIDSDIPHEFFAYDPKKFTVGSTIQLIRDVRKHGVKYVYLTDRASYSPLYLILRLAGVKRIIVHSRVSVPDPYPAQPERGIKKYIKGALARMPALTPDRIYAVSNFVKHRLVHQHCLPADKIVVILNGIDVGKFNCGQAGSDGRVVNVFTSGRATLHKGIGTLIDALDIAVNRQGMGALKVVFAGDGPDLETFKARVREHGLEEYFLFLGETRGTRDHLCQSDVVVVPSAWGDACPSTVSEALAAGKALITTRAGGIPEIVGSPENAILIDPHDEVALAAALIRLAEDPGLRTSLGERGRRRAELALDQQRYHANVLDQLFKDLSIN